jgi:Domain of unknown function (DUF4340)
MKRIVTLLAVLAALIGVVIISQKKRDSRMGGARTVGAAERTLLLPGLDVNNIKKIRIKDSTGEVNLTVSGDQWVVNERSNYPASFDKISRVIMELRDQKISRSQRLGKGAWGDPAIKLLPPGDGDAKGQGLLVDFQDAKGNAIKSLILGGNVESQGGRSSASPFGNQSDERLVRVPEDSEKDTIWVVGNSFYDLQSKPVEWIDKAFIDVKKLKEVEITAPVAADSWKAARKDEQSAYALVDAKNGEELDDGKASLSGLLTSPTFDDVVPKDKATADFMKDAVKAKLTTMDGFTYNLQALKKFKEGKEAIDEKYYLTVSVAADIPKARPPVKDEKEEDKKKNDEKFAADKKALEEKLAKEKKAEGWVFEVSSSTVGSLLKKRSEVLKDKSAPAASTPPAPEGGAPPAFAPQFSTPSGPKPPFPKPEAPPQAANPAAPPARQPISVTTPPVSVPPLPKPEEIKPVVPATENPATPGTPTPLPASPPEKK